MEAEVAQLQRRWIWAPDFQDAPLLGDNSPSSGQIVTFTRRLSLPDAPIRADLRCSADTRYKLYVNSRRIAVGPSRSCEKLWYYDTLDLTQALHKGENEIHFVVWRAYPGVVAALPFERTQYPGLTAHGEVETSAGTIPLQTDETWEATIVHGLLFPTDLKGDRFLHVSEID